MKRRDNNKRSVRGGTLLLCGLLATTLLFQACGVTEPQSDVWQDVGSFSWPTESGTLMKFQVTNQDQKTSEDFVTVDRAEEGDQSSSHNGTPMYVLRDEQKAASVHVHFLPSYDSIFVKRDKFGSGLALVSPIEKGHRWIASETSNFEAEIIELFSWRKIEGKVYENVVAVRYRKFDPETGDPEDEKEYIRFYAKGVGEVMTITIDYPSADASVQTIPDQQLRRVLVETRPAS